MSGTDMTHRLTQSLKASFSPIFKMAEPEAHMMPIVLNSPHSGRIYPEFFVKMSRLNATQLRLSEDCYVDELFATAVKSGVPLMSANFPRVFLDVNREPFELDQDMFHDPLPDYVNTTSMRVAGGLGTIARVVSETEEVYNKKLSFAEAQVRIETLHQPYHQHLESMLEKTFSKFNTVLLIDCHSMPSTTHSGTRTTRPDFILGDRNGNACAAQITGFIEQFLRDQNFSVIRNQPYAGGYITQHYGRPQENRHALQIEINRALYLDEINFAKHSGFDKLQKMIDGLFGKLSTQWPQLLAPYQAAAAE